MSLLQMAINQGYVPAKCKLKGDVVMALVMQGDDPCKECNEDRNICSGRPKEIIKAREE